MFLSYKILIINILYPKQSFLHPIFACVCPKKAIQALLHLLQVQPHGLRLDAIRTDHNRDYPI